MAKCAYCGEERPESELKERKLIFRNSRFDPIKGRNVQFVDQKMKLYCADKPCSGYDQMAHEG